jgi:membrane associated rhomboid family serine protease
MLACPNCSTRLSRQSFGHGVVYACPKCGGRSMGLGLLHKMDISNNFMRDLWAKAVSPKTARLRDCPHCGQSMAEVVNDIGDKALTLDVCTSCQSVWFDPKEHELLPHKPKVPENQLSDAAKQALLEIELAEMRQTQKEEEESAPPEQLWQRAVSMLGLPVLENGDEIEVRPFMIWGLALTCLLVYIFIRKDVESAMMAWGFIPELWYRHGGLTYITSFFLHANILHLGINLYFLLIFGDHLEGLLGRWKLLMLIFGSHIAGLTVHYMIMPHSVMPLVGASAGVAGILAYFTVSFPRARIALAWGFFGRRLGWTRLPVLFFLMFFVISELTPSFMNTGMPSDKVSLAFMGGMAVGVCAAIWARINRVTVPRH